MYVGMCDQDTLIEHSPWYHIYLLRYSIRRFTLAEAQLLLNHPIGSSAMVKREFSWSQVTL